MRSYYGKLIIKKNETSKATCPIHDWKLNFKNLRYENNLQKKIDFRIINHELEILDLKQSFKFKNIKTKLKNNKPVEIRYLSHASVLISDGNTKY